MFPKLNDFLKVQLVLWTCQKHFCLNCWRCSGLVRGWHGSEGLGLRHKNSLHSEEPAAPWAWPLCTCCLLAVLKVGQVPVSGQLSRVPLQPLAALCPWGAAFKWVLNEQCEQRVRSCTGRSGWAAGSHSTDHRQLCLWARGLLGIRLLSKDCPCAALKAQAERIVSWGLIVFF